MSRTSLRSSAHALSQPSPSSSVITSPPAASEINAVPVQPRRGGRTSFNWDSRQTDCLLEQVRAVLPRGHHEWEKVVANYNALMSESADYNRLKDKFFKLVRTVKPTGKNTKPSHIQQAQEISAEIEARVHGGLAMGRTTTTLSTALLNSSPCQVTRATQMAVEGGGRESEHLTQCLLADGAVQILQNEAEDVCGMQVSPSTVVAAPER